MDWDNLRYILTIARAGSLAAAARRLGVNQTTVARRLAASEASLGTRLFDRVDGVLRPTKTGEVAVARAAQAELQIKALENGVGGDDDAPTGLVRITAVPILVNRLLIPALPSFYAGHSQIQLELVAESRNVSLTRREADIALRLSRPEGNSSALTKCLGQLAYAAYGPSGSAGGSTRGSAANRLPWIGYEEGLKHLPQARWIAATAELGAPARLAVNDAEAIVQAIHAGLGKSLLPCCIADQDGGLARLDPEVVLSRDLWLITHHELRHQARIATVINWLQDLVSASAPAR